MDFIAGAKKIKKDKIKAEKHIFEIRKEFGCKKCPEKDPTRMTLDHIIPRLLLAQFGVDIERDFDPDNLEVLCRRCNVFKGSRLDFSNPKTKPLLRKYVDAL